MLSIPRFKAPWISELSESPIKIKSLTDERNQIKLKNNYFLKQEKTKYT